MKLTILVGPPGSGKSTLAKNLVDGNTVYVNQDSQGQKGHRDLFAEAIKSDKDVIVDRMNFNIQQRKPYIDLAKSKGYTVKVIVKCESSATCLERMLKREGHETIKDEKSARSALQIFMTKYEPPTAKEGIDEIVRIYPDGPKIKCIVVDLDGTLCNIEHRRHFVLPPANTLVGPDGSMVQVLGKFDPVELDQELPKFKKNWAGFFDGIANDTLNVWCLNIVNKFANTHEIVYCSGRSENHKKVTLDWIRTHTGMSEYENFSIFMRHRSDSRQDYIVKEILLDFEILPRFSPEFMIDDRKQIVDMWRRRGFVCLHCDDGDF